MAGTAHASMHHAKALPRLWWLPANGYGNGLDDSSWAPILDVRDQLVATAVLDVLGAAGAPAYGAPLSGEGLPGRRPWRVWVGASAHGRAEFALLAALPGLIERFGEDTFA